jgi:hypothetical protein
MGNEHGLDYEVPTANTTIRNVLSRPPEHPIPLPSPLVSKQQTPFIVHHEAISHAAEEWT